jgi:hypothetical protein
LGIATLGQNARAGALTPARASPGAAVIDTEGCVPA